MGAQDQTNETKLMGKPDEHGTLVRRHGAWITTPVSSAAKN
jgi:hypothetical protein